MDDLLKSLHSKIVIKGPLSSSFYLRYGFHRLREKMQNRPNLGHISPSDRKVLYRAWMGQNSQTGKFIKGKTYNWKK